MERFDFDPERAARALQLMKDAPDGPVALDGGDFAHGAMAALIEAELLAAEAGVVPWFTFPDGTRGVLAIGAARERIDGAPEGARTLYLATHGLVRSTHASAMPARSLVGLDVEIGNPPLVIALTVVALAAVIGGAWYLTRSSAIEVEGRNVRTTALAAEAARLARAELETTGHIDPGVWEVFKAIAEREAGTSWAPVAFGGLALAGGLGGFLAWRYVRARRALGFVRGAS